MLEGKGGGGGGGRKRRDETRRECGSCTRAVCVQRARILYGRGDTPWLIHDAEPRRGEEEKEDGNSHRGGNEEPDKYVRATRGWNLDLRRVEEELV